MPEGGWEVGSGSGAAFLALVFKRAADGVNCCVVDVSTAVDEMVVLSASFADDAGVALVFSFGDAGGDFAVEATEDGCAAGIVETGKFGVSEHDAGDFFGVTGDELDDVCRETSFEEDGVDEVIRDDCGRGGFPDYDVSHESRGAGEVTPYSGEVERSDGVDEAF